MKIILLALSLAAIASTPTFAETCRGKWGGKSATTVTFNGGKKVRYCFKSKCWNSTYSGSKDGRLSFVVGKAKVTMRKSKSGYNANWRAGSRKAAATLRCS